MAFLSDCTLAIALKEAFEGRDPFSTANQTARANKKPEPLSY